MSKIFKVLAIVMSLVLLLVGCRDKGSIFNSSEDVDVFYLDQSSDQDENCTSSQSVSDTLNENSSKTTNKSDSSKSKNNTNTTTVKSSIVKDGTSSKPKSSKNSNTSSAASSQDVSSKFWGTDPYSDIPDSVKKNGVHILTNRELLDFEQTLIEQFEFLTNIKVKITVIPQRDYVTKLDAMIKDGKSPDVAVLSVNDFPNAVVKYLNPIEENVFRLKDDIWNKSYMENFKINGKYYSVAINGSLQVEEQNYVTYYNTNVLKECGVTATPYDLYLSGKWNWQNQRNIAYKISVSGKGFIPISLESYDLYMLSAGEDFIKLGTGGYTNNLEDINSDSLIVKAWNEINLLKSKNMATGFDIKNFNRGNIGLITTQSYGMYSQSGYFESFVGKSSEVEAVPIAGPTGDSAYTPIIAKCFGVPKGALNTEGAAYFLRYFLDPENIDTKDIFYNKQFQAVFSEITNNSLTKKLPTLGYGILECAEAELYANICNKIMKGSYGAAADNLLLYKEKVQTAVKEANKKYYN